MSAHHPPLTCSQFKTILTELGFKARPQNSGTSHEQWVKVADGRLYKVTVDCPKAPFSPDLISSMAKQAGVTKAQIYDIYFHRSGSDDEVPSEAEKPPGRYEPRPQPDPPGFWCVWDKLEDCLAFNGNLSYLTEEAATERAAHLNV
jgi:predicted RNA binding protein YcfA (HicA-like mRNA interferase family)